MREERFLWASDGRPLSSHHSWPLVYFFQHARSPVATYPGHAWLPVPPRKKGAAASVRLPFIGERYSAATRDDTT
jgi:hypothetical protein